jgi:hypothetical protein
MPNLAYTGSPAIPLIGIVPRRVIDPDAYNLVAQVTVDEDGDDEMTITEHPVEQGAAISDHAYKRPAELRVRVGWSDAYVGQNLNAGYDVSQIYLNVLQLQSERRPFTVVTGKRQYSNMLVASLRTHTDSALEFSFIADIIFREILLVNTGITGAAAAPSSQSSNLATPSSNQNVTPMGTVAATQASLNDSQVIAGGGQIISPGSTAGISGLPGSPSGPSDPNAPSVSRRSASIIPMRRRGAR